MTNIINAMPNILTLRIIQHQKNALNDVVDIGKITAHVAMVEYMNWLALYDGFHENKGCHVGSSPRAIDGEKAKTCGRKTIEFAIGVGHKLIALFCCSIEAYGRVGDVILGIRDLISHAVDAAGTGVDQMAHIVVPTILQYVQKAQNIALDIGIGVFDGVSDASLST